MTGLGEYQELQQPRCPSVAIAEGVKPRNIEMRVDCGGDNQGELILWDVGPKRIALEPFSQPVQKVIAVFGWRSPVVRDNDRIVSHLARHNVRFVVGPDQHLAVEFADQFPGNCWPVAAANLSGNSVQGIQCVFHFPLLVLAGRRCAECAAQNAGDLLLGKGISLDGRRSVHAPDRCNLIEVCGQRRVAGGRRRGDRTWPAPHPKTSSSWRRAD